VKILIYAPVDFSKPGGLETHVLELCHGLGERGHAVDLYGQGLDRLTPDAIGGARPVTTLDPERYDVVHQHAGPWPAASGPGPRCVRTLHFCVAAKMAVYVRMGRLRTLANLQNWRARSEEGSAVRSDGTALIAVSERVRSEFERHHGLTPSRARVISNGASFARPQVARAAGRARHGLDEKTPVLLTIGRPDFVKGYDLLRRAWDSLGLDHPNALWVSVGGLGPERGARTLVTGPVSREDVVSWIHAADFGALPSYYEGCSVALLEMLAGSLPVLAHDVGNAAQVIRPGVNGAIVRRRVSAWTSALQGFLQRPPPRPANGLDLAYRWDSIVASIEEVYQRVRTSHR
jgi:glycosyltransferase involved in cell wall biosynthesis